MIEDRQTSRFERLAQWPALALVVLASGVSLSVYAFQSIRTGETRRAGMVLEKQADELQAMLAGRVREYHLAAWYLRKVSRWIGPTNRAQFGQTAQGLLQRFPELKAVEWSPHIPGRQRGRFEQWAREAGFADFSIKEPDPAGGLRIAGDREAYTPIYFVEPYEGNEGALGLDLEQAVTAPTVAKARRRGLMHLSAPIRLVQEPEDQSGAVLYVPYYAGKLPEAAAEADREAAFKGVFQLVFRGREMFGTLLNSDIIRQAERLPQELSSGGQAPATNTVAIVGGQLFEGFDVKVRDRGAEEGAGLLYFRSSPLRREGGDRGAADGLEAKRTIHFAGRHWEIGLTPVPEYLQAQRTFSAVGTLSSGLAFTVLMLAYVLVLQRKSREVQELVQGRTMDLERSYRQLEQRQERLTNVNVTMGGLSRVEVPGGFDLGKVLEQMCRLVGDRFQIDRVGVWLFTSRRTDLKCVSMYRRKSRHWTKGRVLTGGEFPGFFDALDAGSQIVAVNARLDRRTEGMTEDYLEPEGIFSMLASPIVKSGKIVGAVIFDTLGEHRRWAQEETTIAGALADFVTLALTDEERADAEVRLRASERVYHSLVENLPQLVFRKDLEGRFTFVNEQFGESFRLSVDEILGRTDQELSPPELAAKYQRDDERVIETGEVLEFVEECELSSGRVFLHTCKTPIRNELGAIVGVQGISWDITERYRLQAALNASDERFRLLVDSLDCIVWETSPDDFQVSFVSKQAEKILGHPVARWIEDGEFWARRIDPEDRDRVLGAYREVVRTGRENEFEYRMTAADGHQVWVRDIVTVEWDEKNAPVKLRGLMIDTTETHVIQSALHESTELMRLFIQHTPTSVAMFDREMGYILASRRWYEDNNLVGQDIVGKCHYEVVPDIPERWRRIHQHCLAGNSAESDEDAYERADGHIDYVRWELHPWHKDGGEVGGIIMFAEIITDRVKARLAGERGEAILQATGRAAELFLKADTWREAVVEVMEHLGDALGVGRIRLFRNETNRNEELEARLRFEWLADQGAREIGGASRKNIDWGDRRIRRWRELLSAGGVVKGEMSDFDGKERDFLGEEAIESMLVLPLRVRGGWWGVMGFDAYDPECAWDNATVGALKGAVDNLCAGIERELAESERIGVERRMQDSQRLESLGVLAGGIAHDFNNLLTAIIGNAGLARMDLESGSPIAEPIDVIEKTSLRAADLCKQMLAYAGKGRFEMVRLELNELVADTTDLLRVSISKKAELAISLAEGLPRVMADASQIQQIIMNLVINASEAIGDRPGKISVSTGLVAVTSEAVDEMIMGGDTVPKEAVRLTVSDTGEGMTEDTLKRVFEPFYTTKFTGRGLGLAAVQGIIKGHGGALRVKTETGEGSSFEVFLPVADEQGRARVEESRPGTKLSAGARILVVDDEAEVRDVTATLLQKWGVDVATATNGQEGVDAFRRAEGAFDLVLMDYLMPRMNGVEAAAEMRAIRADVKVLLMSGFDEENSVERHTDAHLAGFLQKPFPQERLREMVASLLTKNAGGAMG